MIAKFIQTSAHFQRKYEVIQNGEVIFHSELSLNSLICVPRFYQNNNLEYTIMFAKNDECKNLIKDLKYLEHPSKIKNSSDELVGYIVRRLPRRDQTESNNTSNNLVGYIVGELKKIFSWYYEYEIGFYGNMFYAYEIGMGKDGIKIPIYKENEQIALIEKGILTYDNKDEYDIYAIDDFSIKLASLFSFYYDYNVFGNYGEHVYKTKKYNYLYTTSKALKSKYNASFKQRILAQ